MRNDFDARLAAARILDRVERDDAWADEVLNAELNRAGRVDQRDRALATALVYGVLRNRHRLDAHIGAASSRKLSKIQLTVLAILRVAAFQLLYLERVPASAAVNGAVESAKKAGAKSAAGFVNAVLRKISSGKATPAEPKDEAGRLALQFSLPPALASLWLDGFGPEGARALAAAQAREPALFLRVDRNRADPAEVVDELRATGKAACGRGFYAPDAVFVRGGGDPRNFAAVREGRAFVQGQSSQLIAPLLKLDGLGGDARVLDACAAPGMKTVHIASLLAGRGAVTALELHPHRVELIRMAAKRSGYANVTAEQADAARYRPDRQGACFNRILVDAPCTGLGVLARNPERKWRIGFDDWRERTGELADLQLSILENVSDLLESGGVLVYSTCTTTEEENAGVVGRFLDAHPEFELDPITAGEGPVDGRGMLTTYPPPAPLGEDGGDGAELDGFFAARLIRRR